ncbi:NTPase [Achromobacter marplatensis]|uniref:KAP-like P-loop ATPase n=1 Tax=Achromobacter marplatensis TaxID=470868 RepID=A0ABX9G725_9BURK|nr:NTPase [Achromobacter marplatensis]RBP18464.1 putative KAP-like P-loop ATPase [Achromobacter marplatensis]CAB3661693.1 hypothetical protein LMG26219_03326 [Achromobacter marplatensis]
MGGWVCAFRQRCGWNKTGSKAERLESQRDTDIGTDVPIRTSSEDRLRRSDYAKRIATVLAELSPSEGRVFAIRGGWGYGKSSLKNLIIEQLDDPQNAVDRLDFNPWQWGGGDSIARALFSQIADRLGGEHSTKALDRADALRRYGAILTGVAAPIKSASNSTLISTALTSASVVAIGTAVGFSLPSAAVLASGLAAIAFAAPLVGRVLAYFGRDRRGESLDQVREALERQLRDLDRPLIVFVDDIDRLEPEQIRMLLRQVKANANLPNIVFVLLFQPSIVEAALKDIAGGDGRAFLEKIVQTNFDLPAVPVSTVHRLFGETLGVLAGAHATEQNGFSETRWGNVFIGSIQPLLSNMRDARRLLSSISVHLPMHMADDVFEVNLVDFLLLEAIRVAEPNVHGALFRERDLVLQLRGRMDDRQRDQTRAAVENLLESASLARREATRDALVELFPQLARFFGGVSYGADFHAMWLAEKRVCSPRYFARYFELQTAAGEVSERRFVLFLESTESDERLAQVIEGLGRDDLLSSLVKRLDESVDRLPIENAAVLLPAMFSLAQKFAGQPVGDAFSSPWISAWRATNWYLKRIPQEQRAERALAALERSGALSVGAVLIHLSDPADLPEERRAGFAPALNAEGLEGMKAVWLRLITDRAARGEELLSDLDLFSHLSRWAKFEGSLDVPKAWVAERIRTDAGFAAVVSRMATRGTSHTHGDRVSTSHIRFNRSTVEDFIGIEAANTRIQSIDFAAFAENQIELEKLKISLESWLGLREPDPFDL